LQLQLSEGNNEHYLAPRGFNFFFETSYFTYELADISAVQGGRWGREREMNFERCGQSPTSLVAEGHRQELKILLPTIF
jgi:hypothetical protein